MTNKRLILSGLGLLCAASISTPSLLASFLYESDRELVGTGDFDGDGRQDMVIVDKPSGKYRVGYQLTEGVLTWVNQRSAGSKDVSAATIGRLLAADKDAIAFTAPDANGVTIADASNPNSPTKAINVPFEALGPSGIVAHDIGGSGNTPLDDLFIGSIYNDPNPYKLTLLRNQAGSFAPISEGEISEAISKANRVTLKAGGPAFVAAMWSDKTQDNFRVHDLSDGKPRLVAELKGLPKGYDYRITFFRGAPLSEILFFKRGESGFQVRTVSEPSSGTYQFGEAKTFDLGKPIRALVPLMTSGAPQMLVVFGKGESAEVFKFDGASAPASTQTLTPRQGELFFGGASVEKSWYVLSAPDFSKFSTHCQSYMFTGATNTAGPYGKLSSMADSDDSTVPDIRKRIVESLKVSSETEMTPYTNNIPGSKVPYSMIPIHGGEFVMGTPDAEPNRQPDEGPQHKVKIEPFWMGKFEVTWNEYEIFMYPDDEKKLREANPTEDYVNAVSDAVTRPSKPYTEMSFGMGRDGYPAICMTQHSANKYCHWLSAKTGHFYRLPTEAEWEYACRAGTTNAYSFGDDPKGLAEYGWYEDNSDFKYNKVGKKKPNPWGLYDMHGNVSEWCLDQYDPGFYAKIAGDVSTEPWNKATLPYPHAVKGGSYDDEAAKLRSGARRGSERGWKMRDPQLPKSIWWHSDAPFVGFRIIRPLKVPSAEEMQKYWTSGVEKD